LAAKILNPEHTLCNGDSTLRGVLT
jgi:hypothetical protein